MTDSRIHTASRVIVAPPRAIFRAMLDPEAMAAWRPPRGMTATIFSFDPRVGGGYRMAFRYAKDSQQRGKSTADADVFTGRFIELAPDEQIVEAVEFETDDPRFAGTMTITTLLKPVSDGTKVTFRAENVPAGISAVDHRAGMESTLENLAKFIE